MEQFIQVETFTIELLLLIIAIAIIVRRLRFPYTVALVLVGLAISYQQPFNLHVTPQLILTIFVPPLVFEAAFHLNLTELRRNFVPVLILAVPGVILTTLIVGGILSLGAAIGLGTALVFAALISTTDSIAVVALFRSLGIPKRLSVLMESESLLNNGTAIVVYGIVLAGATNGRYSLYSGLTDFVRVVAGGLSVGFILGWLVSLAISRVDDYLIETTLTTILAFGAYLVAEQLQFSGVLAVVAAGLVNGNVGPRNMSPTTRIVIFNFWEYVAFLANSFVFLLIGIEVNVQAIIADWQYVLWAIVAVLVARTVVVYGMGWLSKYMIEPIPMKWQHIINWGGVRGAISLALALSIPATQGVNRSHILVMTFGVVLFTLLVQSTSMKPLIKKLDIVCRSEIEIEYETRHARLTALRSAKKHLMNLHQEGVLTLHTLDKVNPIIDEDISELSASVRKILSATSELEAEELQVAQKEFLRAQRSTIQELFRNGIVSEEVYENLVAEIDSKLMGDEADFKL